MRRVGGYNIDALVPGASNRPGGGNPNLAHLLVGSEGTLAFSTQVYLGLHRLPKHKVLGICHFPTFYGAMESTQHIVKLDPAAVELVDRNMMDLARDIPIFRPTIEKFVRGAPDSLLLVEFAGDELEPQLAKLKDLNTLMSDLGYPDAVVEATIGADQSEFWNVRKSGLNIMMSMKGDGEADFLHRGLCGPARRSGGIYGPPDKRVHQTWDEGNVVCARFGWVPARPSRRKPEGR